MNMPITRIPPQSVEAEQTVLGTMLLNQKTVPAVIELLSSEDFYKENHKVIFESILSIFKKSGGVDILTVSDHLKTTNKLDHCGGPAYLAGLTNVIASTKNIRNHCDIIKDRSRARSIITIASNAVDSCYDGRPAKEVFSEIGGALTKSSFEDSGNTKDVRGIISDVMSSITSRYNGTGEQGISSGYVDFDSKTGGLQKSDLILIAGRPSMGKTTFAMNIVSNVASAGKNVFVFSLEMSKEKLVEKQVSSLSGINIKTLQRGTFGEVSWPAIKNAAGTISKMNITIDDSGALHISQIHARAKMAAIKNGVDLIVVDYIGLARATAGNREREVSEISAGLKALAKELKIPVIALSQLSRKCEERTDKRPLMSDLRDSGSLEQDADIVAFVYRDEVYNQDNGNPMKGIAEIIIRKNRCGETGTVEMFFDGARCKFENLQKEDVAL